MGLADLKNPSKKTLVLQVNKALQASPMSISRLTFKGRSQCPRLFVMSFPMKHRHLKWLPNAPDTTFPNAQSPDSNLKTSMSVLSANCLAKKLYPTKKHLQIHPFQRYLWVKRFQSDWNLNPEDLLHCSCRCSDLPYPLPNDVSVRLL